MSAAPKPTPGAPLDPMELGRRAHDAMGVLLERITPWLFDIGTWVFGGLTAFGVLVISALLTVGPADAAILVSIGALACALPLNVAGICVLRLVKDMKEVGIDDLTLQAFKDAGYPEIESYYPPVGEREARQKRRRTMALWYSLGIAALTAVLTVTGLTAALWYMAWWIGVLVLVVAVLSVGLVALVLRE
jgi:hypothetical protein